MLHRCRERLDACQLAEAGAELTPNAPPLSWDISPEGNGSEGTGVKT